MGKQTKKKVSTVKSVISKSPVTNSTSKKKTIVKSNSSKIISNSSKIKSDPQIKSNPLAINSTSSKITPTKNTVTKITTTQTDEKLIFVPEQIRTIADDILDIVNDFEKIHLKQLMTNIRFNVNAKGVPIVCASCVHLKDKENSETKFIGYEQIKNIKVKTVNDNEEKNDVISSKEKDDKTEIILKNKNIETKKEIKNEKSKQKYEIKEFITKIIVHSAGCVHQQKNKSKLGREISVSVSKNIDIIEYDLEKWVHSLAEYGTIEVVFPINIFADILIKKKEQSLQKKEMKEETLINKNKKKLHEYIIERDGVISKVIIWDIPTENVGIYELINSKICIGTESMLKGVGKKLTDAIKISSEDITDPKKMMELKDSFKILSEKILGDVFSTKDKKTFDYLVGTLVHRFYGLGILELIIADDFLEEIVINSSTEAISVYHRKYGWLKTTQYINTEMDIYNISAQIGRKVGQQINSLNPIMDAHLLTGDRVASTIFPVSTSGNTITIRRFSRNPWSLINFISDDMHLFSKEIGAIVWLCMQYELNIIVAGGTASGKTSVLNILSSMITPQNRILSIEDTREIQLPEALHWNWIPLTSKRPNPEGQGEVSMLDLIVAALRMRPDRIIVGEIRKPEQAQALFEAMHTGHSVYATLHADTASQVIDRLKEKPMSIPATELSALHLIIMQYRDRRTGKRRTREVVEITPSKDGISLNHLYRWQPRTDRFEKVNDSIRIFEELSLHTGMTPHDIEEDLSKKAKLLQWMLDCKVFNNNLIGDVFRYYYKDPEWLFEESKTKTVQQVLDEVNEQKFAFVDKKDEELHYKKDKKELIAEQFYKKFDTYNDENWLKFLKTIDLSDPETDDLLYEVKKELKKT
ncbi:MAG: type II/IV secretion system ATPase subunit [Candidatus Woesearchaeota archaeon]|jgi:flagellar protein FlaI